MLEKLLNLGSFDTIMGHLTRHQVTFPTSLGWLGLPSMVQFAALVFLGCWALIAPTLIFRFQQDCRNPTLAKCGGEAQHLEKLEIWSPPGLPNVGTARPKTPYIEVFLVSFERS